MKTKRIIRINYLRILIISVILVSGILPQNIQFERLSTNNGLSNNLIYDIIQGRTGFLWIDKDNSYN
jgi:ligand-binding sensor domain-containing protein